MSGSICLSDIICFFMFLLPDADVIYIPTAWSDARVTFLPKQVNLRLSWSKIISTNTLNLLPVKRI